MKNVITGLIVMLVSGFALIGCSNPTETERKYLDPDLVPVANYSTLSELIAVEGGAHFQSPSRSLRFFADGGFQVFSMGLSSSLQNVNNYGSRYIVAGNTIKIYRAADADAAPFYTITYTLNRETLTIVSKADGAGTAPTNANLPVVAYSQGILPEYRP